MTAPRRLQLRRGNSTAISSYTGAAGELVVNTTNWTLYVHDGVTVGGYAATVNTASISGNINSILNGTAVFGNLIPSANVIYSLGNITHQWNDLFVSNNTIFVGGVPLTIDATGNLRINGNIIPTIGYVNTVVANVTVDLSSYALNANVTAANVGLKGYVDQANTIQSAQLTSANLGIIGYIDQANTIQSAQVNAANLAITAANVGMKGYVDASIGNISIPQTYGNANVAAYLTANPIANLVNGSYTVSLGADAVLTLPSGGTILESGYLGAGAIRLKPNGGTSTQYLEIAPTAVDGNHVHLMAGSGTELFLGDDNHYVKLANTGGVVINSNDGTGNTAQWAFGTDGTLTLPGSNPGIYASDNSTIYTNYLATTTLSTAQINGTNAGNHLIIQTNNLWSWQFNSDGSTAFPGNVTIEGNLFVNGNVSYISVNNVIIGDNIINLADLNPADSLDLGFVAHRTPSGQPLQHTGLIRDASANQWRLFSNVVPAPGTTVDFTDAVYDDLQLGNITSPTITAINNNIAAANAAIAFANTIQSQQISAANVGIIGYIDQGNSIQSAAITAANVGMKGYVDNAVSTIVIPVTYSNINVKAYTETMGFANYSNVNVAAYLSTNSYLTSATANLSLYAWNGNASGSYSNVQVATYLPTYTGTLAGGTLNLAGQDGTTVADFQTGAATNQIITLGSNYTFSIKAGAAASNRGSLVLESGQNSRVRINGNGSNVLITAGNGTQSSTWTFANSGVLTFPDGTTQSTAATGGGGSSNYGNVNVKAYTESMGFQNYGNANVSAYLPSHTGNVGVNTLLGTTPNISLTAGSFTSTFDTTGNVVLPSAYVTGNVTAGYVFGNGAFLTGVVTGSSYSNVQVATYLPTYTGVVTASNVAVNGNVTAQYIFGNGSQLTGLPATYSNIQTAAYLNATGYNLYSNANVASYLPLYGGDISARNITVSGNIALAGNALLINSAIFYGNTITGFSALYAGIPGYTPIPQVIAQFTADFNGYAQINSQNLSTGNQASSDFIATANNGTDSAYFIDMGIAGSGYDPAVAANNNAIGTALTPNDAYLYTAGNTAAGAGGNLVIGVQTLNKNIRFFAGGVNANNVVLTIQGNGITTAGNVTGTYFIGSGQFLTGLPTAYSNVNVKAYTETIGLTNYSNVNVKAYTESMGFTNYGDSNVASYLNTYSGNISAGYFIGDGSQLTGLPAGYSNVNVKAYTETMGFVNYGNVNVAAYLNATGYNLYSNVNVAAYLSTFSGNIANIRLGPSGVLTFADGTTQTTAGGGSYSNVQVGAYLTTGISTAAPQIQLTNATSNYIRYSNVGVGAPTFTTSSVGTRVIYWPSVDATTADYAVGIDAGVLWHGIPRATSGFAFKWYAGNTQIAMMEGTGLFTVANIRLSPSGNIVFADGTVLNSAATVGGNYSNVNVAVYLPTYGGTIQSSNVQTTTANIQATTAATNTATGALRVMGGVGVAGAVVAAQLNSTGNVLANAISAYSLNTVANVVASVVNAGTINSSGNVLAQNLIGTIATASQTGITAVGTLATLTVSGNATVGNLIGTEANTRIIANTYITTFDIYGNVTFPGNITVGGFGAVMPTRPAFRVNGTSGPAQTTSNVNLKGAAVTTIFNQGGYFDATTGKFTAPVAGIYEVSMVARVNTNSTSQIAVLKNGLNSGGNIVCFWEADTSTGTATHFGTSGTVIMAAGDYLSANILLGNISFDGNDNWCVTYLG